MSVLSKNQIKFGTSGFRGIINKTFTNQELISICNALSIYLKKRSNKPTIAIAYDPRQGNCPELKANSFTSTVVNTLTSKGISVHFFTDFTPTPFLAWYVPKYNLDGGLVLTASHNPPEYNGIKFNPASGAPAEESITSEIEKNLNSSLCQFKQYQAKLSMIKPDFNLFSQDLKNNLLHLGLDCTIDPKLSVSIDSKHGTAFKTWEALVNTFQLSSVFYLQKEPLEHFNGIETNPCNTEELTLLKDTIHQHNTSLGIANDPDADRHIILDENAQALSPEETALIILDFFLAQKINCCAIISTLASSMRLNEATKKHKFLYHETMVGFKYIAKYLEEYKTKKQLVFGVESSGGFSASFHTLEKCGFLPGILILLAISYFKKPLSELKKDINKRYGNFYFKETALRFQEKHTQNLKKFFLEVNIQVLQPHFSNKISQITNNDGLKIIFQTKQWALLRFSGTEPLIRIYVESSQQKASDKLQEETLTFIKNTLKAL